MNHTSYQRPLSSFLTFIMVWLICMLAFSGFALLTGTWLFGRDVITAGAGAVDMPRGMEWLRYGQLVNQFGFFILPSILFSIIAYGRKDALRGLGLCTRSSMQVWLFAIILIIASVPLVNSLIEWNESLNLPESLGGVESWMRRQEDAAVALSEAMVSDASYRGLAWNILLMAILPGIGEELLFRGTLQPLFVRWTRNAHLGVLLAAFAFSAMHVQFFGFVPRLFLGLLLGYVFLWSRNLWIPMAMHFLNNFSVVFFYWLSARGLITEDPEVLAAFNPLWALLASIFIVSAAMWGIWRARQRSVSDAGNIGTGPDVDN